MILNDVFVIAASSGSETPHWKKWIFGLTLGAASLESFVHLKRHGRARLRRSRVPVPLRRRFAPVGSFRRGQRSVHNVYKNLQSDFDAGAVKHDTHSRLLRDSRDLLGLFMVRTRNGFWGQVVWRETPARSRSSHAKYALQYGFPSSKKVADLVLQLSLQLAEI